tara:strand:- start:3741 stop:7127 length:3387 start_codon:yes stop_codon:yes gene_type:complete
MKRDAASERQVQAAEPGVSTWVSANAGSGKTRVLTDRVARLLLEDVSPEHILCLTYTKAAASEMQNRLFKRLGGWAMKPDAALRTELSTLGITERMTNEKLRHARTLFARAIEAPGGLKIQTIHSFCAALLRRFPLEAGVGPNFKEMDDRAALQLRGDCVEQMALAADKALVARFAEQISAVDFDEICGEIIRNKALFSKTIDRDQIYGDLGLPVGFCQADLFSMVFTGGEDQLLNRLISALKTGSVTDQKNAGKLTEVKGRSLATLKVLENVFLAGAKTSTPFMAKLGKFPTKKLQIGALSGDMAQIDDWMRRVETAREHRLCLNIAEKTVSLGAFAQRFIQRYEAQKLQRGWLDFDDLILKARDLLTDPALAQWVLYRLDGGIDHILVDEAQDTSPVQWQVIERLAQEFTSGQGARSDIIRTIFVVGDKKQSIYSFQGADPSEFDRMKQEFGSKLTTLAQPFQDLTLEYSFRSAEAILRLVDCTFRDHIASGFGKTSLHRAFKTDMPGRVDLWPVVPRGAPDAESAWYDPVDRLGAQHHSIVLAHRVATEIQRLIDEKTLLPVGENAAIATQARPVQPGDFLVLVQRRSELFEELIRACKARGLPIAGADRLKVGAEIAVRDLTAVLAFLATPEDSLSLAVVLKSPLFGWDEQALFSLAHGRSEPFLWQALRQQRDRYPALVSMFETLMGQTDFLRPYELIERILTRYDGRRKLLARLGVEAEDGIDALLSQALSYEQGTTPSLSGFLIWMQTDKLQIKRQIDSNSNQIRVMTVHGAKGLEAPIVILPDTARRDIKIDDQILKRGDRPLWSGGADERPQISRDLIEQMKQRQDYERDRLLYVAITRAEKWLMVAAAGDLSKDGSDWYSRVSAGLSAAGATAHRFEFGVGQRVENGDWAALVSETPPPDAAGSPPPLPAFTAQPAPLVTAPTETLSPSNLGGAKALSDERGLDTETALQRGQLIHLLLEHLPARPESDWPVLATQLLSPINQACGAVDKAALLSEATVLLTKPDLRRIFTTEALAEVDVSADLPSLGGRRVHGTIDRLVIDKAEVLAIDFKSNVAVPSEVAHCPEGILRQMAAYAEALQQIYPDHKITMAILWTKTATLMSLPDRLLSDALSRADVS